LTSDTVANVSISWSRKRCQRCWTYVNALKTEHINFNQQGTKIKTLSDVDIGCGKLHITLKAKSTHEHLYIESLDCPE